MKFEPFIARRYLFSGQQKALVSVITFISIAGVAVGVFALIVVLAVMEGFDANLVNKIMGVYPALDITATTAPLNADKTLAKLREMPEVTTAGAVIMRLALVQTKVPSRDGDGEEWRQAGVYFMGIDLDAEPHITAMMAKVRGEQKPTSVGLVLGKEIVRDQLGVPIGSDVIVFSPQTAASPNGSVNIVRSFELAGEFDAGYPQTDSMIGYMSLEAARDLFRLSNDYVDSIHVAVKDPHHIEPVQAKIREALGPGFKVETWQSKDKILFDTLRLEKWAMFIILLLIVLVAAFNIIGTLIMTVMDKTREIGILKSMGATRGTIMRIFLYQGIWIGAVGTFVGSTLGLLTCYLLKYHIKLPVNTEMYLSDRIPMLINPWMNALIILSAILICLAASLYPARQAAKLDPVEALRYE